MSEIWTAKEERDGKIIFEVEDEQTHEIRQEERHKKALPLMFTLGGCSSELGMVMMLQTLPWRFRQVGDDIYLDGPSVGVENYHPVDA